MCSSSVRNSLLQKLFVETHLSVGRNQYLIKLIRTWKVKNWWKIKVDHANEFVLTLSMRGVLLRKDLSFTGWSNDLHLSVYNLANTGSQLASFERASYIPYIFFASSIPFLYIFGRKLIISILSATLFSAFTNDIHFVKVLRKV